MFGDVAETLESVKSGIADRLTARTAYSDPVVMDGVTVIPVARVALGFGAGGGVGEAEQSGNGDAPAPAGGGGGGGGIVQPLGFIEMTDAGARWVPLEPPAGETIVRGLMIAAVLTPLGGRRGLIGRLIVLLLGQLIVGRVMRPTLPPLPEGMRFGRFGQQA